MPSPIGHALAGIAAGWLVVGNRGVDPGDQRQRHGLLALTRWFRSPKVLVFGLLGMLPDVDFLFGSHSTYTHSIGAVFLVGIVAGTLGRGSSSRRFLGGFAAAMAYGSHVLLDWLGRDHTEPFGVMALWPLSDEFVLSEHGWFLSVCREVWELRCWIHNAQGVTWEVVVLAPLVLAAWYLGRGDHRR